MNNQSGRPWALIAVIVGILLYGGKKMVDTIARTEREKRYMPMVDAVSDRVGLDRNILRAIVAQESNWNPEAANTKTKDFGLTQININNAIVINKRLGRGDVLPAALLDPGVNLVYAEYLLREIKGAGIATAEGFFHSWNIGWPAYKKGTRSPFLAKYAAWFDTYNDRETEYA